MSELGSDDVNMLISVIITYNLTVQGCKQDMKLCEHIISFFSCKDFSIFIKFEEATCKEGVPK